MTQLSQTGLVRAIGRWSLAALIVNSVVGSGVFKLPSEIAGLIGTASTWAVLAVGAMVGVIMACFAEVASQFTEAGGPYLYTEVAFGRFWGIQVGWMLWLVRLTAPAANANLFVIYLGQFWPAATQPLPRLFILTLLIGVLALINLRGVRSASQVSNIFTVAKLAPLVFVAIAGIAYLASHPLVQPAPFSADASAWLKAVLLLMFSYGGFEGGITPMSEAKNPRRDAAFALFAALVTCTLLYAAIQFVVVRTLVDPIHSERPLADVVRLIIGNTGPPLMAIGALISVYGYLSANMLAVPRITFALGERGDFPSLFASIHGRFHTPYFSILVFASLTWLLSLLGSFSWNVLLSAVARLFCYGLVCAAVPVLRRKQPGTAWFRLPGGIFFSVLGTGFCVVLIIGYCLQSARQVNRIGSLILLATILAAFLNWMWVRGRSRPEVSTP
ncbi:MAG TPA: APC family permease [Terriglobales bacterium]|nr:APC family permease [Terriglobales bacterium]